MCYSTPYLSIYWTSILDQSTSKKDLWWTFQTRGNLPVQIGLKQMSVLELRGTSCTIARFPKDPNHTSVGLSRDVHSMIVLKWWIWKFHYLLVKILKILVVPNENLNREKLINRFWANLNSSQFAFVTKMNKDSWRFLILTRIKQNCIWKMNFFLFEHEHSAAQ